jgi:hypothetical protein
MFIVVFAAVVPLADTSRYAKMGSAFAIAYSPSPPPGFLETPSNDGQESSIVNGFHLSRRQHARGSRSRPRLET